MMNDDNAKTSYLAVGVLLTYAIQTFLTIGESKETLLECVEEMWDKVESEWKKRSEVEKAKHQASRREFTCPAQGLYYFHWEDLVGDEWTKTIKMKTGDLFQFPKDCDDTKRFGGYQIG